MQKQKMIEWFSLIPYKELVRPLLVHEFFKQKRTYQQIANRYGMTKKEVGDRIREFKKCYLSGNSQ